MGSLNKTFLLALTAALVLAGCATTDTPGDEGDDAVPDEAQAQRMFVDAASDLPDRLGMEIQMTRDGQELMTVSGAFDNASGWAYMQFHMDPAALQEAAEDEGSGGFGDSFTEFFTDLTIYTTTEGSLYLRNGTAFVFPPADEDEEGGGFIPSPQDSPAGEFLDPGQVASALSEGNVTVKSVTPTTYRGQAAVRMQVETTEDNETREGTVVMFLDPTRIAHFETVIEPADEEGPFAGALASVDFYYDDEITLVVPPAATRAVGLAYESDKSPFSFSEDSGPTTWTFLNSGGIAIGEIEAHVKDASANEEEEGAPEVREMPTLWSMPLADGTMTQDGVTLTYDDADGDGTVSKGDTLIIETAEDVPPPQVVLYDTVTDTYVVPGPGLFALAGAALAVALVLRRK